jgi:hypothetical protein
MTRALMLLLIVLGLVVGAPAPHHSTAGTAIAVASRVDHAALPGRVETVRSSDLTRGPAARTLGVLPGTTLLALDGATASTDSEPTASPYPAGKAPTSRGPPST